MSWPSSRDRPHGGPVAPAGPRRVPGDPGLVDRVRAMVEAVEDPELPAVTIGMLGMVHDVVVDDVGNVVVELLPTFAGCPATDMIRTDVLQALATIDAVDAITVLFRYEPVWTPERINEQGRRRLEGFGIAPPRTPTGQPVLPANVRRLPVAAVFEPAVERTCPYCQSTETTRDSAFGPTPCRDLWMCHSCRQPFEGFKSA